MKQTAYDVFVAQNSKQASAAPQQVTKSAADAVWENSYWETMAKQAAVSEAKQAENLFNAVFEDRTEKLAAADPWYGQFLHQQAEKQAFNQAFESTIAQYQQ